MMRARATLPRTYSIVQCQLGGALFDTETSTCAIYSINETPSVYFLP